MIQVFDISIFTTSNPVHTIFKVGLLLIIVLFGVFLFVILTQIRSMNKVVTQPDIYPFLLGMAWSLIILALALFVISVAIL